ncbi:hypothetical protein RB195_016057 [Necator americanus]|uniref:Uncharacterized protein n=1 Tax=Necator americanus TaxID=51031 RepID=A0ABR1E7D4_NECAM
MPVLKLKAVILYVICGKFGSPRVHSVGDVVNTHIAKPVEAQEEDMMQDFIENPSEALIESIGPGCLSLEEQENCFVEPEETGFFTPILPSAATAPRRAVHTKGESTTTTQPITSTVTTTTTTARTTTTTVTSITTSTTTTTTEKFTTMATTTPTEPPRIIYLSDYDADYEVSTEMTRQTPVTKPLEQTTVHTKPVTVLPRPYESVREAAKQNPDYLGDSIWASVDLLPEPMVTGPAWRTHKNRNSTRSTTTTAPATSTTKTVTKTMNVTPKVPILKTTKTTTAVTAIATTTSSFAEKSTAATTFSTFLSATTAKLAKPRTTPSFTVYPVRPTTPMGDLITTTIKASEAADFPRTALISIASVSVIMVIAVVVFCVFRCRQNPPPGDHYPMACNGKSQQGYTSIAPELSPPLGVDHATQPLLGRPTPQMNGNGYQSMKGAIITNGNGMNGHAKNGIGGGGGGGGGGKKDFKEWYV